MDNPTDISALLSGLSSNPALLGMLSNLINPQPNAPQPPPSPPSPPSAPSVSDKSAEHSENSDILAMLNGLISGGGKNSIGNGVGNGNFSGDTGIGLQRLLGGKTEAENRIRLLNSLRPYLGEDRRAKLDIILKLLKLAELGQLSGLLGSI